MNPSLNKSYIGRGRRTARVESAITSKGPKQSSTRPLEGRTLSPREKEQVEGRLTQAQKARDVLGLRGVGCEIGAVDSHDPRTHHACLGAQPQHAHELNHPGFDGDSVP